jgi:DNA-binding transcriptional MerR regulator
MSKLNSKLVNISELAKIIGLLDKKTKKPLTHTIRFWEKKFTQIKPTILAGKRRYYTKKQVDLFKLIYYLLKKQKLTLEGAKLLIKKRINNLDDFQSSSITDEYFRDELKKKTNKLLLKIKKLKKDG